jgi:hypothetical protein
MGKLRGAVDDHPRQGGEAQVLVTRVLAQRAKGKPHVQAGAFGEDPGGLLDDNSTVQRGLQLLDEHVLVVHGPLLQQPDRGGVGERLGDPHNRRLKRTGISLERFIAPTI